MPLYQDRSGIDAVMTMVTENFAEPLTLTELAAVADMQETTLTRHFNRMFAMSPIRWVWHFRTVLAAELIAASPHVPLTEVAMFCGFNSSAHFSRRFRETFSVPPRQFRAHYLQQNIDAKPGPRSFLAIPYDRHIHKAMARLGGTLS